MKGVNEVKSGRKIRMGVVSSDKMEKTVVITVERQFAHPIYKKIVKKTKKFMAHDENNECRIGDRVRIQESRPLSARKRWKIIDVVERAK